MDKSGRMTNILKREDFVNEQSLNEKNEGIKPLKKYSEMTEIKPLSDKERVKKFEEYMDEYIHLYTTKYMFKTTDMDKILSVVFL